jgi:WD40 repeat protein
VTDVQGEPPMAALYNDKSGKFSLLSLADAARPIVMPVQSKPAGAFITPNLGLAATNDWEGDVKGESDVRLWDPKSGQLVRRLNSGPNNSVRISPSGKYLLACGNGPGAGLWNLPDLTRGPKLETSGDDGWFMPDEKLIGILNNDNLDLVRISDASLIGSFPGDSALAVVFAPNGRKMYTGYGTHFYEWDLVALRRELRANNLDWED